jgi:hypothetical protein
MLWIRLRFLTVATLTIGIISGGASLSVRGFQEPALREGPPSAERPTTTTAQTPPPKVTKPAAGQPATTTSRAKLRAQQLAARKARVSYEITRLNRELAEIAVEEYEVVTYPRDLAAVQGEISLAESDLARFQDRLQWAKRMLDKGYVTPAQKVSEELSLQKAQFAVEQAGHRQKVLVDYTRTKTIRELRSEVEKAQADERVKEATWQLEQLREIELERQHRLDRN